MSVCVVTDSTADISSELVAQYGIEVVPLSVTIGDDTMPDGTLTQPEFFARMAKAANLPTTSQPPVGQFVDVYEHALSTFDEVISLHISSKLSGTFDSARQAAEAFQGRVHVFDSRNLSWGLGLQVLYACREAAAGVSAQAVMERLEGVRERVRLIVGLDSLHNLAKGGRIGSVSAFLGSVLDLKVTFTVDAEGSFAPVGRSRGEKAALRNTLDWVSKQMGNATRGRFAVGYAMHPERAQWLADEIRKRFEALDLYVYETGTVIASHTGTGWGIALLPEE